jgi:peptidyl-Asp metalloendopeptidase
MRPTTRSLLHKALHAILLLSLSLFSTGNISSAQAQAQDSLFTEVNALRSLDAPVPPMAAVRSRPVGINFNVLAGPQGDVGSQSLKGNIIRMNLFEDTVYDVVVDSVEASASGGTAWNAHIDGLFPSYAYMVYTDGVFAAHVASPEGVYEVQYAAEDVYTVSELDHSLYPDDIVLEPALPKNALPPVELDVSVQAITYIDVMVVYTSRAVTAAGGASAMNARVDLAVQETNQSYINSNVNQRINLVYQGEITYNEEANPDFSTTLNRLTGKADGFMDNVHSLRDTYNADLVSLFIEGTQYCGIAWMMSSVSVSFESSAFSVVAQSCATGYYSFAHEMGHNMGSRHDTYVDPKNTPYPYSHGFTYPAAGWRSIMAYNNACLAVQQDCTRLQYWSNPTVNYGGVAMGNASNADNHASLNNTAATVAAFRAGAASGFNKASPSNGATSQPVTNLGLSWDTSAGATQYGVCYDTSDNDTCDSSWQNKGNVTSTTITGLSNNTTYYWQVRAVNAVGTTYADSSNWHSFTTTATLPAGWTDVKAFVGTAQHGTHSLESGQIVRESYTGVNAGPVQIASTTAMAVIAAERLIYKVGGINTSFTEMMALPNKQLDTTYWLPWYNNNGGDLDTQLRFANVSTEEAHVDVFIGDLDVPIASYTLQPGESRRESFPGVNAGPVKIVSDQDIVAAERLIYKVGGISTSFSEMMALPQDQLDTTYWLPWYNNGKDLDTQLRFANVSTEEAHVQIFIGDLTIPIASYTLQPGESTRQNFGDINDGPVKIVSDQAIVAAERLIYKVGGVAVSFTETMALPQKHVDKIFWLPWYNNVGLDTQLRIANVSGLNATVTVTIGGVPMDPIDLPTGESTRVNFPSNAGPVQIESDQNIVVAERLIYKAAGGVNTSFSEMMALPAKQLDTRYWLPWYNNNGRDLDTQLRFGVP